jgi:phosphoribosylformimino-5-aminoimidazole carboxamide ribotide isomerase
MLIYPAIDLLDGRCVRLKQGGFDQSTVYSDDPRATLKGFESAGSTHLHLVDLSGAKDPSQRQSELIAALVASTRMKVQVGGGIRSFEQAAALLDGGVDRVVIGSAAVSNPTLVSALLSEFGGERITVSLDVRINADGVPCVALHGWKEQSPVDIAQALKPFLSEGLSRVLCTDIALDGMMTGPNHELYSGLMTSFPGIEFQASGGVSRLEDLLTLKKAGVRTAIVGKAIYEGAIDLKEALTRC